MSSPIEKLIHLRDHIEERSVAAPQKLGDDSWQSVAFLIGKYRLLVNVQEISEVIEVPKLTSLPGVQPWVSGIANVRGAPLPLIDLGLYLGQEASSNKSRSHVISLDRPDTRFGLIVDQVIGMRQVQDKTIKTIETPTDLENYLSGAVEIGGEVWQIFDMDQLIFSEKFRQVAAA